MPRTRTRTDLIEEALRILGVSQTGQQPSKEDADDVDREINGVLARLSRRKVLYVQDDQSIDDEYFRPLAIIVAGSCDTGTPPDANSVGYAEQQLREMQTLPRASSPLRICPF